MINRKSNNYFHKSRFKTEKETALSKFDSNIFKDMNSIHHHF